MKEKLIWIIGSGPIAQEYAKILLALDVNFIVIGNREESANIFFNKLGIKPYIGGVKEFLKTCVFLPTHAIVCVNVDRLASVTIELLEAGITNILCEKPGGLNVKEILSVASLNASKKANTFVAYNRRFFSSLQHAIKMIKEDGGVTSFNFQFTEWAHIVTKHPSSARVKERWFLANSSHVVDMAFFLGGKPVKMCSFTSGSLDWHNAASVFSGAGIAESGALFSYQANWSAPGRWSVEVYTSVHKYIFCPLESLQIQKIGSTEVQHVDLNNDFDLKYKPGFYKQTEAFISGDTKHLLSIKRMEEMFPFYLKIANYKF